MDTDVTKKGIDTSLRAFFVFVLPFMDGRYVGHLKRIATMLDLAKPTLALLALTSVLAPTLISAQTLPAESSGPVDTSFGTSCKMITDFGGPGDLARALVVQPDGKIVAAGLAITVGASDFALARYNRDGTLDVSFGAGGRVTTDFAGSSDAAFAVALQPDGKMVVAGDSFIGGSSDFALARYNRDGMLDASFGPGGKVTIDFLRANDQAFSVAVQPDGRIVAAGQAVVGGRSRFALAQYGGTSCALRPRTRR